ncbi:ATP-binding cassette domain-containing protein, partial [Ectothiorhodospira mobilis]|uniref:ATP-binding cassette domain-containing protein n=1 Tax=Ectothiorhodospira mobilis TaxID=195064 RepID=UPI001904D901
PHTLQQVPGAEPRVSIRNLNFYYGATHALKNVSIDFPDRQATAMIGPSGCGKSTLLRLLSGLEHPSSGEIDWGHDGPPAPGEIGYVFQDPTLLPWADAAENVYLPLRLRGVSRAAAMPRVSA